MKHGLILLILVSMVVTGQNKTGTLPRPTGKYCVGVTYLGFTDHSRKELFDNEQEKSREITVKAWYPSDIVGSDPEPYLLHSESEFAIRYLQFPEIYRTLKSNSVRDVPLSSKENKYPVLVFSHGLGEHYSQNSVLMEELASHGYIVFSISHHYECKFSSFPDGRFIYIDMSSRRLQKIMGEMANPKALELLQKFAAAGNDEERLHLITEMNRLMPTGLSESAKYWAEDISFFIDQLHGLNKEHGIFKNKLKLNGTGVFGMSLGGLASMEASQSDTRIKACVNMDGGLNSQVIEIGIRIPAMFLNSERFTGYGKLFTSTSGTDCYSFSVSNSGHYNFSDYSIYPVPVVKPLLGSIDGIRSLEIMNTLVLDFFDRYMKGKRRIDLLERAKAFPEIEAVAALKKD